MIIEKMLLFSIIYPFWNMATKDPDAVYASINLTNPCYPALLEDRSIVISRDIDAVICDLA